MRDPNSSGRRARRVAETHKRVIRQAKAAAKKGWVRCGLCMERGERHDWRVWLGRQRFVFSGVRPHVCRHCVAQHRSYHAALAMARSWAEAELLRRGLDAVQADVPDLNPQSVRHLVGSLSTKMRRSA
jgi:hypothetical protein